MSSTDNPDERRLAQAREGSRRYRDERRGDPEWAAQERERHRRYHAKMSTDPDYIKRERERSRVYLRNNREAINQRRRRAAHRLRGRLSHGNDHVRTLAAMWEQQGGCCYLCGDPVERKDAAVDHDHTCCPLGKTCATCRRGFACRRCNLLIGMVDDDVMLLRRIAGNLGVALDLYRDRIAAKPVQLDILDAAS